MTKQVNTPETTILEGESPKASCPYCERPFDTAQSCALHIGGVHTDEWTAEEKEAYEEAKQAEEDELWMYHMWVVVTLGVMYAVLVLIYMVVLG